MGRVFNVSSGAIVVCVCQCNQYHPPQRKQCAYSGALAKKCTAKIWWSLQEGHNYIKVMKSL